MSPRCHSCQRAFRYDELLRVRSAEMSTDGELIHPPRRFCAECLGAHAIVFSDRLTREMIESTVSALYRASVDELISSVNTRGTA